MGGVLASPAYPFTQANGVSSGGMWAGTRQETASYLEVNT